MLALFFLFLVVFGFYFYLAPPAPWNVSEIKKGSRGSKFFFVIPIFFLSLSLIPYFPSSPSSNSSSSSSSRSSGSIRSCLSGGERAFEVCVSNNPRGKGRLTCESNWKTKLRSCCNKYPIEATDELQCLSLH
jgi:hypothetical protein